MSKKFYRPEKRLLPFLLALFLALCHFVAVNAHYAPPYHFNPAMVKEISVRKYSHNYLYAKDITDREQIRRVVRLLNSFKYTEKEEPLPMAGCGTSYSLRIKAGFREIWIYFSGGRITVEKRDRSGTVIFHGPPHHFLPLLDLADGKIESLTD